MADPAVVSNPLFLFFQNWDSLPEVSCSYETQIEQMIDGSEQRKALRSKPVRRISTNHLAIDEKQAADLYTHLRQSSDGDVYMPIFSDQSFTTASVTASATIPCDTKHRRLFAGHKAVLVAVDSFNRALSTRVVTIQSKTDSALTLTAPIAGTLPQGSYVFPVIESKIVLGHNATAETDRVISVQGTLTERTSAGTLPAILDPGVVPVGVQSFRGLPVLDIPHNWTTVQEGLVRKGRTTGVGLGDITTLYGSRAFDTARLDFLCSDREEAWRLISFFDSCRGSARPFWYPHKINVAQPVSASSFSVTVPDDVPLSEWTSRKLLAVWYRDGTVVVRIVTGSISSPGFNVLTLNASLPNSNVSDMAYVSFASLARLSLDEMTEVWESDGVMRSSLQVQAVPFSGDPTCIGMDCEDGDCTQEGDCLEPPDPACDDCKPGPPFDPRKRCIAGSTLVPMYYDMTQTWNSGREPIRAADLLMPDIFHIEIKDGLVADLNHPHGQDISDELKEVLFRTHELTYVGDIDRSAKSRNPYHLKVAGVSPAFAVRSGGELVENSPAWEAEVPYTKGEATHTLTIRMYAEWVDNSASANDDSEFGAWGTVFCLWAWTDEITMSYTDGTPYPPFNNKTFTRDDPFVGGLYVSEASSVKRVHPQALFFAVCPTTWHSPIGYSYHSRLDRNQFKSSCFSVDSGAPWSGGSAGEAQGNNAFGSILSGAKQRAIGSLGGWTQSRFFNWACIENGAGVGRTILKPTNAGWDESEGNLTLTNDIRMDICTPPQAAISPCAGHPEGPYQGLGGTHDAFRDNTAAGDLSRLCYSATAPTSISLAQRCVIETTTYGGSPCKVLTEDCESANISSTIALAVEDYFFGGVASSPSNRRIEWAAYEDDPEYVGMDFPGAVACDPQSTCWPVLAGSGTILGEAVSYTVTGGKDVGYIALYAVPAREDVVDGTIFCTTTRTGSQKIALGQRIAVAAGEVNQGYVGAVDEAAGTVRIYKVTASDTLALMATASVTIPAGAYSMAFRAKGDTLTLTLSGSASASLVVVDCQYPDNGKPAILGLNSPGSVSGIQVIDDNWVKLKAQIVVIDQAEISVNVPLKITEGWRQTQEGGSCASGCEPEDCPGGGCPCTRICKRLSSCLTANSGTYPEF